MKKLSVVVPVYNQEKYIRKTIESVLGQTYPETELVLVNDGSTDGSGEICREYSESRGNVRLVSQENMGLKEARMSGVRGADGEYILFVDGDDWIEEDFCGRLMEPANDDSSPDIVIGEYVFDDNGTIGEVFGRWEEAWLSREQALVLMFQEKLFNWSGCGKLYRRAMLLGMEPWWFSGDYGEDTEMNWKLFNSADSVRYVPAAGYHYCMHPESMMHSITADGLVYFERLERILSVTDGRKDAVLKMEITEHLFRIAAEYMKTLYPNGDMTAEKRGYLRGLVRKYGGRVWRPKTPDEAWLYEWAKNAADTGDGLPEELRRWYGEHGIRVPEEP